MCVARLSGQKRIEFSFKHSLVCCAKEFVVSASSWVTDRSKSQLVEQARGIGLSGHVFFEGFQTDVRPYLLAGDAFILTSDREGLPLSILEAMACGLPCLVTEVGGNAEAVTHLVHGLVVAPRSVDAVADAISYLATHPDERAQMSKLARARACEAFDIEVRMAEIECLIRS